MLKLKTALSDLEQRQITLAEHCGLSSAAISLLIHHQQWPRTRDAAELRGKIQEFLALKGASQEAVNTAFDEEVEPVRCNAKAPANPENSDVTKECDDMLLRKQVMLPETKRAFSISRAPFDDLQSADDMYLNQDFRYIREVLYQAARHDGFVAVVGESGAGKSSLRRDLINRLRAENAPVIVIEPYVLATEDRGDKGKPLKTVHIAEAIMATVAPHQRPKSSPDARFRQMHQALKDSYEAGNRHVVLIEEAHSLPLATLKHLKRLRELEIGFTKLLSVILIGQTELKDKLSERNPEVREVVQRIEIAELLPVPNSQLADFIAFRLSRVGKQLNQVIDDSGLQEMTKRLTVKGRDGSRSLLHPLAIGNLMIAAMNLAAKIGEPLVTADVVKEI